MLSADLVRVNIARRRAAESDGQWRKRYGLRAGIEGTNSEMKRRHGLGRLRVRGGERVRLAVYLKALACNVKRMVGARLIEMAQLDVAAPVGGDHLVHPAIEPVAQGYLAVGDADAAVEGREQLPELLLGVGLGPRTVW